MSDNRDKDNDDERFAEQNLQSKQTATINNILKLLTLPNSFFFKHAAFGIFNCRSDISRDKSISNR